MQEEKRKAPDNTDENDFSKVQEVSMEVDEFLEDSCDIKDAIDDLMKAVGSIGERLEMVLDDELAVSEGRLARTLLALLAEQAEKLKNEATSYKNNLEKFVNK